MHKKASENAEKVSASELLVNGDVFHKILNSHKGSSQNSYIGHSYLFIPLYFHRFNHLTIILKIFGQKEQGGIIKVVAVVNMVLNFLITDKSIMAERSYVPYQYINVQALHPFHQVFRYKRGRGIWDDPRTSQKSPRTTLYSVCYDTTDWTNVVNKQNFFTKSLTNLTHLLEPRIIPEPI